MREVLIAILISFILVGCSAKRSEIGRVSIDSLAEDSIYFALPLGMTLEQYKEMYSLDYYRSQAGNNATVYVDFDCAVIVHPTAQQTAILKNMTAAEDENIVIVKEKYSESLAGMIRSYGVKTIVTTDRFINFKGEKGTWEFDLRRDTIPDWKVVLFKVTKEPVVLPDVLVTRDEV